MNFLEFFIIYRKNERNLLSNAKSAKLCFAACGLKEQKKTWFEKICKNAREINDIRNFRVQSKYNLDLQYRLPPDTVC